jgi:hypothetical protein
MKTYYLRTLVLVLVSLFAYFVNAAENTATQTKSGKPNSSSIKNNNSVVNSKIIIFGNDKTPFNKFKSKQISLPKPSIDKIDLYQTFQNSRQLSEFIPKEISLQDVSNLLFISSCGALEKNDIQKNNLEADQLIHIFIFTINAVYYYDSSNQSMYLVYAKDYRSLCSEQKGQTPVPLFVVYVADYSKINEELFLTGDKEGKLKKAAFEAGATTQNLSVYCASTDNLDCSIISTFDKVKLAELLELNSDQEILTVQSIGYIK